MADNTATTGTITTKINGDVDAIKYYLSEFENSNLERYTVDCTRPGPAILALTSMYYTLRNTYVYFRLNVSKVFEKNNKREGPLISVGLILLDFFTNSVYSNKREFEVRHPCLSQMITVSSGLDELAGSSMTSLYITE